MITAEQSGGMIVPNNKNFISEVILSNELSPEDRRNKVREVANKLSEMRDLSKLAMGQLFHEISTHNYHTNWGYDSFEDWADENFEGQKGYARQIRDTYSKWMIDLPGTAEVIGKIKFTKLVLLKPHVTTENFDGMVKMATEESFQFIKDFILGLSGKQEPDARGGTKKYKFQLTEAQALIADQALEMAAEAVESEIPGLAYEHIFNHYILTEGVSQGKATQLAEIMLLIESTFDVKLSIEGPVFEVEDA